MSMMLDMLSLMVGLVSMTVEENVWESGEEKMTLLPEAVGAGMWKPEYEFPGMHCSQAHTARHALPGTARHALQGTARHALQQGMHCKACTAVRHSIVRHALPVTAKHALPCTTVRHSMHAAVPAPT